MGFFDKLKERIAKTKANFSDKINNIVKNFRKVDEEFFEELLNDNSVTAEKDGK